MLYASKSERNYFMGLEIKFLKNIHFSKMNVSSWNVLKQEISEKCLIATLNAGAGVKYTKSTMATVNKFK